jgi:hypothetical protein
MTALLLFLLACLPEDHQPADTASPEAAAP